MGAVSVFTTGNYHCQHQMHIMASNQEASTLCQINRRLIIMGWAESSQTTHGNQFGQEIIIKLHQISV